MGKISDYANVLKSKLTDLFVVYQRNDGELETKNATLEQLGNAICGEQVHSDLKTDNQTIIGGINELAKDKNIADEYDDTHTYNKGDVTIYGNTLYICNTNNTTGDFDPSKWTATTVQSLIGSLSSLTAEDIQKETKEPQTAPEGEAAEPEETPEPEQDEVFDQIQFSGDGDEEE